MLAAPSFDDVTTIIYRTRRRGGADELKRQRPGSQMQRPLRRRLGLVEFGGQRQSLADLVSIHLELEGGDHPRRQPCRPLAVHIPAQQQRDHRR